MNKGIESQYHLNLFEREYNDALFCVDLNDEMNLLFASDEFYALHNKTREEFNAQYGNKYELYLSTINDNQLIQQMVETSSDVGKIHKWNFSLLLDNGINDYQVTTLTCNENNRFLMFGIFNKETNEKNIQPLPFDELTQCILLISANKEMRIFNCFTMQESLIHAHAINSKCSLRNYMVKEDISRIQNAIERAIERNEKSLSIAVTMKDNDKTYYVQLKGYFFIYEDQLSLSFTLKNGKETYRNEDHFMPEIFDTIAKQAGVAFWILDFKLKKAIHSESAQRVFGIPEYVENIPEGLMKYKFIHVEDVSYVMNMIEQLLQTDDSVSYAVRFNKPNTDDYWWGKVVFTRIYGKDGECEKAVGTVIDISEQKRMEYLYSEFVKNQQDGNHSAILYAMCNLSTGSIKNLVVRNGNLKKFTEMDSLNQFLDEIKKAVVSDEIGNRFKNELDEKYLLDKFGHGITTVEYELFIKHTIEQHRIKFTGNMNFNPFTSNVEIFITIIDINDEYSNRLILERVVNNEFDYVVKVSAVSSQFAIVIDNKNQNYLKEMKGDFESLKNTLLSIASDEDKKLLQEELKIELIIQKLAILENYSLSFSCDEKEAKIRKMIRFFKIQNIKELFGFSILDITQEYLQEQENRDVLEQALISAQQANKSKTRFLSTMSHDIRTPLNAILGLVDLAYEDINNREKIENDLDIIHSSTIQLMEIVNDILDISKIENGNLPLNGSDANLIDEIMAVVKIVQPIISIKNQKLLVDTSNLKRVKVIADRKRLHRVWMNLLTNASKYSPEGTEIQFNCFEFDKDDQSAIYRFEFIDQGYGIAEDKLEKIFSPFYRDPVQECKVEGTGLGLSIVKNFVESKGGTIDVVSKVNEGTKFTVTIPYQFQQEKEKIKKTIETKQNLDLKGLNILLVEDNEVNTMVARRMLENLNTKVTNVSDGYQAVETFKNSKVGEFDAILMDIQMPVCNGLEATKMIRNMDREDASSITILAMSALTFVDDMRNSINAGMNHHLTKPLNSQKIYDALVPILKKPRTK